MLFKVGPVADNRRASQSVVASRSVCDGQNFCRSASATHCNCQFLLVGWCELGFTITEVFCKIVTSQFLDLGSQNMTFFKKKWP